MQLKRTAVFRTARVLSWFLPVLILVFVGIAALSYRNRSRETQPRFLKPEELSSDLLVKSDLVQYVVSESGKNQYQVRANQMRVLKARRRVLSGVEILIYSQKPGDPDRRIQGKECVHDEQTDGLECRQDVSVELEEGTIARTQVLSYDPKTGLISSSVETLLERIGEMTGHSGKMDYFVETGLMKLADNFVIDMTEGGGIRGGTGTFQYKEHWATVTDGVELTSTNGRVLGGSGRADLLPGTYRARRITVESGASAESPSLTVTSDWLQSDQSDSGSIEHVLARGNVQAERKVPDGTHDTANGDSLYGILKSPEIEAWMDNGTLKAVEARQQSSFVGTDRTLNATEMLRIEPQGPRSGSIRTQGESTFLKDSMTVKGRNFSITEAGREQIFTTEGDSSLVRDGLLAKGRNFSIAIKGEDEITFTTLFRAELKSGGLITRADKTEAQMDTKTNTLASLKHNGNVSFEEEKTGRSGAAEKLTVHNGGDRIELEGGKPRFTDAQGTLNAQRIAFDRKAESFSGDGSVRMTNSGKDGKPVVVSAGHVEGSFRGESPRLNYTGRARMVFSDGQIDADNLSVFPNDNRFEASGKVTSLMQIEVRADRLEFRDSGQDRQTAHYSGNVFLTDRTNKNRIMELRTQDLNVQLKSGENGGVEAFVATEGVVLTQGTKRGRGERLEYNARTGETTLLGRPGAEAEIRDTGGVMSGCKIQIKEDGSKNATECAGGSVTSEIKVNRN